MGRHAPVALALTLVLAACVVPPTPAPTGAPRPTTSPTPTVVAEAEVSCVPDPNIGIQIVGDPCPGAVAAARAATANLGYEIRRVVLRPGPFYCGVLWPGVQSQPICFGPVVIPGRQMHGWVGFDSTDKIAAVSLWRDFPTGVPTSTPSPWSATVAAFEAPPPGWQMPSGSA